MNPSRALVALVLLTAACGSPSGSPDGPDGGVKADAAADAPRDAARDTSHPPPGDARPPPPPVDAADAPMKVEAGGGDAGCAAAPPITSCSAGTAVNLGTGDLVDAMYWSGGYVLAGTHSIRRVATDGTAITPWTELTLPPSAFSTQANGIQLGANAMGIVAATRISSLTSSDLEAETWVLDGNLNTVSGPFSVAKGVVYIAITRDGAGFAWGNGLGYFTPLKPDGSPLGTGTFFSNPSGYPIVAVASGPMGFLAGEWFAGDACEFLAGFDSSGGSLPAFKGNLVPEDQEPMCALTAGLSIAHAGSHYLVSYARFLTEGLKTARFGFTVVDDSPVATNAWAAPQPGAYGSNVASDGCRFGIAWTVNTSGSSVKLQASFQVVSESGIPLAPLVALGAADPTVPVLSVATPSGFVVIWQPSTATELVATLIECK